MHEGLEPICSLESNEEPFQREQQKQESYGICTRLLGINAPPPQTHVKLIKRAVCEKKRNWSSVANSGSPLCFGSGHEPFLTDNNQLYAWPVRGPLPVAMTKCLLMKVVRRTESGKAISQRNQRLGV
jgi:hypothetical protein